MEETMCAFLRGINFTSRNINTIQKISEKIRIEKE